MKLPLPGGRALELARSKPPKTTGKEQGQSGRPASSYFDGEQMLSRVKNPTIADMMRMLDNDGTAQGLYNIVTFPVQACGWHLEPHPDDVKEKTINGKKVISHPQADFAEGCLRNPEHEGGMSTPFSLVLADILLAVAQGHRFFEIVYKVRDDGFIVFKKLVAREDNEYTILYDDEGGFAGVEQNARISGRTVKVQIELPYCFMYTYRKERNKLRGASGFRAAYYHYDKKHRLYYLQNQQAQVNAMGLKVLESPDDSTITKTQRDENLEAVDKMAIRPSIALPFGWKLSLLQPSKVKEIGPDIDGHDVQMARSMLAHGMLQGNSSQSSGGSYSLGQVHFDVFMLGELALMASIEEHITAFLISKIIDFNFDQKLYPKFKFNSLSDDVKALTSTAFEKLIAKGAIPKWVARAMSDKVAEYSGLERPAGEDALPDDDEFIGITASPTNPGLSATDSKKKGLRRFSTDEWWRPLTSVESKVQFDNIKTQADRGEQSMLDDLQPLFEQLAQDTVDRLEPLLDSDNPAAELDGFTLNFADDMQRAFAKHSIDTYGEAKRLCADEIKKKAPANRQASKDLLNQQAQQVTDKQYGDMLFGVKNIVTEAIRKQLLERQQFAKKDVLQSIFDYFDQFYADKEALTTANLVSQAVNLGRDDVFTEYSDKIYGYQYSAILDEAVCAICEDLDASVVTPDDYAATVWIPPIHFNCRCIWVAIMEDETDKPEFTGLPDTPGGATAPLLQRAGPRTAYGKTNRTVGE